MESRDWQSISNPSWGCWINYYEPYNPREIYPYATLAWPYMVNDSRDVTNGRLSIAKAEKLFRTFIYNENPNMNPEAQFPLKEITTDEIWSRMKAQVFKIDNDINSGIYLIKNKKIDTLIGRDLAANDLISMYVTDLSCDGKPELTYSYSWGSGILRSNIAIYSEERDEQRKIISRFVYLSHLVLEKIDDQNILVKTRTEPFPPLEEHIPDYIFGQVALEEQDEHLQLVVNLDENLPSAISSKIGYTDI